MARFCVGWGNKKIPCYLGQAAGEREPASEKRLFFFVFIFEGLNQQTAGKTNQSKAFYLLFGEQ